MDDLGSWATDRLTELIEDDGVHGPGSSRTLRLDDDGVTYLRPHAVGRELRMLRTMVDDPVGHGSRRAAITFDRPWDGADALWIYAVERVIGSPGDRVLLVLPYRTLSTGRARALGEPVELDPDHVLDDAPPVARCRADDSATYWSDTYGDADSSDEPEIGSAEHIGTGRPTGKRARTSERSRRPAPASPRPPREPKRTGSPTRPRPEVRSVVDALGAGRRYLDAALVAGFGVFCIIVAGDISRPVVVVLAGVGAIGYSAYIAFSYGGYVIFYWLYALAVLGGLYVVFG